MKWVPINQKSETLSQLFFTAQLQMANIIGTLRTFDVLSVTLFIVRTVSCEVQAVTSKYVENQRCVESWYADPVARFASLILSS